MIYTHLVYSANFALCFQFLLDITVVPRQIEENGCAKFWSKQVALLSRWKICEEVDFHKANYAFCWILKKQKASKKKHTAPKKYMWKISVPYLFKCHPLDQTPQMEVKLPINATLEQMLHLKSEECGVYPRIIRKTPVQPEKLHHSHIYSTFLLQQNERDIGTFKLHTCNIYKRLWGSELKKV